MKHFLIVAALAFTAVSGPAPAAAAVPSNPCSLLSNAEASRYAGVAVTGKLYGVQCRYTARGQHVSVGVGIVSGPTAAAQFNAMKSGSKPFAGLGYPAYYAGGSMMVMKGSVVVIVSLIRNMSEITTMDPQLPELTKLVLSRM